MCSTFIFKVKCRKFRYFVVTPKTVGSRTIGLEPPKLNISPGTQFSALAQNGRAHPLQNHLSYRYDFLHTLQPQYLRKLINIKPAGSTRSSNHLTVLRFSTTSSLKNLIVHTTEPLLSSGIIYQNLWELSLTRHLILQPLVNVPPYYSHFLRPNFAHISKHTFSASRTHLNLLSCTDWPHRSLP